MSKKYKTDLDKVREIRNKRYLKRNKEYQKMFVKTKDKQDYIDWLDEMRVIKYLLATQRGKV